jgi:flagellar basal-body rod protein FlgC
VDYSSAFQISASGMSVERVRLEVTALNIANANTTRGEGGRQVRPLRVIATAAGPKPENFSAYLDRSFTKGALGGVTLLEVREVDAPPRRVHEPSHPYADERGFVAYPGINPVAEMIGLMATIRAYEANVVALNAAKTMALRALDIGRGQ